MKKVTLIRKALRYAKYMSEEQMIEIINRITNSELSRNGYRLDQIISDELIRKNVSTGSFVKQWLDDNARKNVYLHPDIPAGLKEYFIDTALDNLIVDNISDTMEVNFEHMESHLSNIMDSFLSFCKL